MLADLKERLIQRAGELGISELRIADAQPDALARERMQRSFERDDLATWGFGERYAHDASAPERLLPGARRVICIAVPYATAAQDHRVPLAGRVSNYAWSRDYHRTLYERLHILAAILDRFADAPVTRVACDTAPLAERAYAARAGLGWVGKHTNLIAPSAGSYIFLGEIVTTLELPIDAPLRKSCGSCRRCVDACPTGALRGDYTIDATLCISDLTQRTDAIPRELRASIGRWVWGCDLCQVVCPPNERAALHGAPQFEPLDADAAFPNLEHLLRLRSGEFKRRYAGTAMGWRGAAVLRRNAAIALGNTLDRAAVPALAEAVRADPHPMVRGHAAWSLGRIGSLAALLALRSAALAETDPGVLDELSWALGAILEPPAASGRYEPA